MTSKSNSMQDMLEQVVSKLKISIKRIEEQFLPELKFITSSDEKHDFKTVVRENIKSDFDFILKLIDEPDKSNSDIDDEDDDRTVFGEIMSEEDPEGETESTINQRNENKNEEDSSHHNNSEQQVTCNNPHNISNVEQNNASAEVRVQGCTDFVQDNTDARVVQNSSQEFQDTPSSVPDYIDYNTSKNTYTPLVNNQPNRSQKEPLWKEKVNSYLNNLEVGSTLEGTKSIPENDDNMSLISSFSLPNKNVGDKATIFEANNNVSNDDKENTPVDLKNPEIEELSKNSPNIIKNIANNNDSGQIILLENRHDAVIPASNTSESEIFRGGTSDDATMTCISESLLKNKEQTEQNSNGGIQNSVPIEQIPEDVQMVDWTLDSDDENDSCTDENLKKKSETFESVRPSAGVNSESMRNEMINNTITDNNDTNHVDDINLILDSDGERDDRNGDDLSVDVQGSSKKRSDDPTSESAIVDSNDFNDTSRPKERNDNIAGGIISTPMHNDDRERRLSGASSPENVRESVNQETPVIDDTNVNSMETPRDIQNEETSSHERNQNMNNEHTILTRESTRRANDSSNEGQLSEFKVESLSIIDDYTMNRASSQQLDDGAYEQSNSQEEKYSILSEGGNFKEEEPVDTYEVIPSVKVEVVMGNGDDAEENITFEMDTPGAKPKSKELFKKPMPPKQNTSNVIKGGRVEKTNDRKKCELGITSAFTRLLQKNRKKDKHVFTRPGPKSKTKMFLSKPKAFRDVLSTEINNLTNINSLENFRPSSTKSKKKKQKKPSLLDFFEEEPSTLSSTQSSDSSTMNPALVKAFGKTSGIDPENLAKEGILRSECDEEEFIPPVKKSKPIRDEMKENISLPKHSSKEKPKWKKDPLLTGNLNPPSQSASKKPKLNKDRFKMADDDDVRSVCSSIQEKIRDPTLRENLKKLYDARDTIIPEISVIDLASSDDEEEDHEPDPRDDDDNISVISKQTTELLNTEFKATAKERKKRVSSLSKRAQKYLPPSSSQTSYSQESFEDRYKDTPPLVLHINEETREIVSVCPFYSKILKDHQKRGVKFMWDVCFGPKEEDGHSLMSSEGSGCILAHDMGLGKSLQVIALLHTLKRIQNNPLNKVLILSPKSLVQNWEDEIIKWTKGLIVRLKVFSWTSDKNIAVQDLHEWSGDGGIYIMGYEMFVSVCKKFSSSGSVDFTKFFLDPGPDVVICDEAHSLKNNHSEKYKTIMKIKTKRRIALTGTPIQNNLQELFNIVCLVQPTFMKPEKFRDQFIEPISQAQNSNASKYEKSKATQRITVLHKELVKVMDREEGNNQEVGLPPKMNYDIFLELTLIQKKMYKFFFDQLKDCYDQKRNFEVERKAQLIGIHPKSLDTPKGSAQLRRNNKNPEKNYEWPSSLDGNWWNNVLTESERHEFNKIDAGVKVKVAFQILKYAAKEKEKVLIFCNCHEVLNLMETYLKETGYDKNRNYFRLDGTVASHQRRKYLNIFNDERNTDAQVFLLTHKVGGVGLNFTGANRIIIFDMPWNPAHHEQSSNRTHRLGQKKTSFVYRLIPKDTMEELIYKNSVSKQSLSKQVVDKKKIKSQNRETGIFNFVYKEESSRSKKDLPLAKDELLNTFLNDKELKIIHSYREQGELFELSEEQLNEAQVYEEYLQESRSLEQGESSRKKRKRKSKVVPAENESSTPDKMMSKQHIEQFNHSELLQRMHNPWQASSAFPTLPSQDEPMNLSKTREAPLIPPPPLVPIRKGNIWKATPSTISPPRNTIGSNSSENRQNAGNEPAIASQTNVTSKSGFFSLPEFISNTRQVLNDNINPDVNDVFQKLFKNKHVDIIQRPSKDSTNTQVKPTIAHNIGTNQHNRLKINPNIFQTNPSESNRSAPSDLSQPKQAELGKRNSPESQYRNQQQNPSLLPLAHPNLPVQSSNLLNITRKIKPIQIQSKVLKSFKPARRGRPPGRMNSKSRAGLLYAQPLTINKGLENAQQNFEGSGTSIPTVNNDDSGKTTFKYPSNAVTHHPSDQNREESRTTSGGIFQRRASEQENVILDGPKSARMYQKRPSGQSFVPNVLPVTKSQARPGSAPPSIDLTMPEIANRSVRESVPECFNRSSPKSVPSRHESSLGSLPPRLVNKSSSVNASQTVIPTTSESVNKSTPGSAPPKLSSKSTPPSANRSTPESVNKSTSETAPPNNTSSKSTCDPSSANRSTIEIVSKSNMGSLPAERISKSTPLNANRTIPESGYISTPVNVPPKHISKSTSLSAPSNINPTIEIISEFTKGSLPPRLVNKPNSVSVSQKKLIPESVNKSTSESAPPKSNKKSTSAASSANRSTIEIIDLSTSEEVIISGNSPRTLHTKTTTSLSTLPKVKRSSTHHPTKRVHGSPQGIILSRRYGFKRPKKSHRPHPESVPVSFNQSTESVPSRYVDPTLVSTPSHSNYQNSRVEIIDIDNAPLGLVRNEVTSVLQSLMKDRRK